MSSRVYLETAIHYSHYLHLHSGRGMVISVITILLLVKETSGTDFRIQLCNSLHTDASKAELEHEHAMC